MSHAGAGKNTVFQVPRPSDPNWAVEVPMLAQELWETYNDAIATMIANSVITVAPTDNSKDPAIYQTMIADDRMQDISETQPDFTYLLSP